MTKRMKDLGWLLVLALGSGCSAGSDSGTASKTGKVAESEAREPTESSADTTMPAGDGASADVAESEAATAPVGQAAASETDAESTGGAPELVQDCAAPNLECPPPPIGWCDSERDIPIEDWLAEYWNSFCDEDATAPDAGASAGDLAPTGSEPANADAIACGIEIGGPGAGPCPPPPLEWCASEHDGAPVPVELAAYWNSTCGNAGSLP